MPKIETLVLIKPPAVTSSRFIYAKLCISEKQGLFSKVRDYFELQVTTKDKETDALDLLYDLDIPGKDFNAVRSGKWDSEFREGSTIIRAKNITRSQFDALGEFDLIPEIDEEDLEDLADDIQDGHVSYSVGIKVDEAEEEDYEIDLPVIEDDEYEDPEGEELDQEEDEVTEEVKASEIEEEETND